MPSARLVAQWDAKGNRQRLSYTVAGQLNSSYLTQFKQASEQAIVSRIRYSAAGQVLEETAGNGTVTAYMYETKTQRLIQLKSTRPSKTGRPTVLQDLRYGYDPVGNIVTIDDAAQKTQYFANQEVSAQRQYTYDTLYQLITATGREDANAGVQTQALPPLKTPLPQAAEGQLAEYTRLYRYDRGDNLIQIQHKGVRSYTRTIEIAERSNRAAFVSSGADGRVLPSTAQPFDDRGNLLALNTGHRLSWNLRNQLSQATAIDRADGAPNDEEYYRYDGGGMRVSKTTQRKGALQSDKVIYLPGLELRTQNNGKEVLDVILIGEAGRCQVRVLHWEKGKPESIENDQLRYSLDDQIGSSILELNADVDKISEEVYYPYGGTALWTAKSAVEAKYKYVRYSGKERDATGLYYYGYRYYMPWLGRWLNPDPAGTVDGLNLFRMVQNNPIILTDPNGRMPDVLSIPKKAHYVWEGKDIASANLSNILLFARDNPDYEINVWTSRPMSINSTLEKMRNDFSRADERYLAFNFSKHINIREVDKAYIKLTQSHEQGTILASMAGREKVGPYRNYAAASDITRAALMFVEGGVYMDVDVMASRPLGQLEAPGGFLAELNSAGDAKCNAVIASAPHSKFARQLLSRMVEAVEEFESFADSDPKFKNFTWATKRSNQVPFDLTNRINATVALTGPQAFDHLELDPHTNNLPRIFYSRARNLEDPKTWGKSSLRPLKNTLYGNIGSIDASAPWQTLKGVRRASASF